MIKRAFILFIFFSIFIKNSISQGINEKYKIATRYILVDKELKKRLSFIYSKKQLKQNYCQDTLQFSVSKELVAIDSDYFKDSLIKYENKLEIPLDSIRKLYDIANLKDKKIEELQSLSSNPKSNLRIYFTEPIKNSLIAEILLLKGLDYGYKCSLVKSQRIVMFFLFDDYNKIIKTFYYNRTYTNKCRILD